MVINEETIRAKLPYREPFLFVGKLSRVDENGVEGSYTFPENAFYYQGHFKDYPVTPGVILTEVMAQIGVVCLGIFLQPALEEGAVALTSSQIDFYRPVYPAETVRVTSRKEYFRFQKLKCQVEMHNEAGELVCRGSIAGMFKAKTDA
ncbi:3-hydroxyacyl-ACP dehydratase FabZ family protein [Siphonobacter sp. SORGH_AS_1065]|uniref:3-hydroxyacyl-ACP dehydratase FabZ family protein n=1 Tax=Siphonobacter sp. SORGH_AS_1065 TaxID=3041795 RepID=UPI0027893092|nr:hotdog domain-containing protein [Siphonobacter sp. SORGH_AS_1065]MDQ1089741.1 3-hydroxyacyl-[acyl-carrier-protein] dehydratase [Siphonobacter sp. SORGH_AS_1065]